MADPTDDFARSIAENIGLMPAVTKAGEMGSGFINFLGSLLGGGAGPAQAAQKPQAPAPAPAQSGGLMDWIRSTGALDAFDQDVESVSRGGLPRAALKDAQTMLAMTGRGGLGPGMPKIPATRVKTSDPTGGWQETGEILPSVDPIKSLGLGNVFGSTFSDILLKLLAQTRKNAAGIPQ